MDTNRLPEPSELLVPKLEVLSFRAISETQYGPAVFILIDEWQITVEGKGVWYAKRQEDETWDCVEEDGEPFANFDDLGQILEHITFIANSQNVG